MDASYLGCILCKQSQVKLCFSHKGNIMQCEFCQKFSFQIAFVVRSCKFHELKMSIDNDGYCREIYCQKEAVDFKHIV